MKKIHIVLLTAAVIMAICSAYSLGAMNKTYRIGFQWYSDYRNQFTADVRETAGDRQVRAEGIAEPEMKMLGNEYDLSGSTNGPVFAKVLTQTGSFDRYLYIYFSFGNVEMPEYRIRTTDIAQRGNVVEIRLSINTPQKDTGRESGEYTQTYAPEEVIRISRDAFPVRGRLYFIFKNQDNNPIFEHYFYV